MATYSILLSISVINTNNYKIIISFLNVYIHINRHYNNIKSNTYLCKLKKKINIHTLLCAFLQDQPYLDTINEYIIILCNSDTV